MILNISICSLTFSHCYHFNVLFNIYRIFKFPHIFIMKISHFIFINILLFRISFFIKQYSWIICIIQKILISKIFRTEISSFICAGLNFKVNINFIMYFCLCLYILINIISLKCFNISFSSYKI